MKTEKGFAMILALFLTVAFSVMMAGDFLSLARQQRSAQQMADRVRTTWANEALVDYTIKLVSRFVKEKGAYPGIKGATLTDCPNGDRNDADCEIYYRIQADTGGQPFTDKVLCWWNGGCDNQPAGGVKAAFGDVELSNDKPGDIKIYQSYSPIQSSQDPYRLYTFQFQTRRANSSVKTVISHDVKIVAGQLFNFFSFANKDLEICPGPSFSLEGPMFSNGDVYLTSGASSTLSLIVPEALAAEEGDHYAIRSAGHIYFYNKKAVARNYLLCDHLSGGSTGSCVPKDTEFQTMYPDFFRTDEPSLSSLASTSSQSAGNLAWSNGGAYWSSPSSGRKGYWLPWTTEKTPSLLGLERLWNGLPFVYYFKNNVNFKPLDSNDALRPKILLYPDGRSGDSTPIGFRRLLYFPDVIHYFFAEYSTYFNQNLYDNQMIIDGVPDVMNVSPAMDVSDPDKYLGLKYPANGSDWNFENPTNDESNVTFNDQFASFSSLLQDSAAGVGPKTIPIGDATDAHVLIEPLQATDSDLVKAQKLWRKAHVQLRCIDANCTDVATYIFVGLGASGADEYGYRLITNPNWVPTDSTALYDWRLGGSYNTLEIDMVKLKTYLTGDLQAPGQGIDIFGSEFKKGFLVYIETASAPFVTGGGDGKIASVKLTGGDSLPREGVTIVTNGRLWIEGNYNTHHYEINEGDPDEWLKDRDLGECPATDNGGTTNWTARNCHFPSAAIFSDSFGVLSGSTDYSNSTLNGRPVNRDVMVNTAVVSGYLPSQLEKAFPECNGSTRSRFDPTKCFYYPPYASYVGYGYDGWRTNFGMLKAHYTDLTETKSGFPGGSFPSATANLKSLERNNTNGAYYWRTINMVKDIYKSMQEEYSGYPLEGMNVPPNVYRAFDGCGNSNAIARWMTATPNGYGLTSAPNFAAAEASSTEFYCPGPPPDLGLTSNSALKRFYDEEFKDSTWSEVPDESVMQKMGINLNNGNYERSYKLPVEKWIPDNPGAPDAGTKGVWVPMCCDTANQDCDYPHICTPQDLDAGKIKWRKFKLTFRTIPELDRYARYLNGESLRDGWNWEALGKGYFPFYGTGHVNCSGCPQDTTNPTTYPSGSTTPWCQNGRSEYSPLSAHRPMDYDHCTIEPAPLLPGVFIRAGLPTSPKGKFGYVANSSSDACEYVTTYGAEGGTSGEVKYVCGDLGPWLRFRNSYLHFYGEDYGQMPLYIQHYSGGLENLINYQEKWDPNPDNPAGTKSKIRFAGVLTAAWDSMQLRYKTSSGASERKGYWGPAYYTAPEREAYYNLDLRKNPPPGTPGVYDFVRVRSQERDPNNQDTILGHL